MKRKYKSLISNILIFAIGSFGSKIISFFLVPLYTNLLTTEQYGVADLITTVANLAVPVFSLVIQDAILRFGLSGKYSSSTVFKNSFFVLLVGSLLSLSVIPLLNIYPHLAEWRWYVYAMLVVNMFSTIMYAYARSVEKTKIYAICGVINSLILAIANIVFLVVLKLGIQVDLKVYLQSTIIYLLLL